MYVTAALKGNLQPISNYIRVNEGRKEGKTDAEGKIKFYIYIFQKLWEIKFYKICKIIERRRRKSILNWVTPVRFFLAHK